MTGIARMFQGGPEAQRSTAGAVDDVGPRGAQVFSHHGCQSEALQELAQDLGFGMDKPTPVQVALHGYFSLSSRIITCGARAALRDQLHAIDSKWLMFSTIIFLSRALARTPPARSRSLSPTFPQRLFAPFQFQRHDPQQIAGVEIARRRLCRPRQKSRGLLVPVCGKMQIAQVEKRREKAGGNLRGFFPQAPVVPWLPLRRQLPPRVGQHRRVFLRCQELLDRNRLRGCTRAKKTRHQNRCGQQPNRHRCPQRRPRWGGDREQNETAPILLRHAHLESTAHRTQNNTTNAEKKFRKRLDQRVRDVAGMATRGTSSQPAEPTLGGAMGLPTA